jgi:hypothetical protein
MSLHECNVIVENSSPGVHTRDQNDGIEVPSEGLHDSELAVLVLETDMKIIHTCTKVMTSGTS